MSRGERKAMITRDAPELSLSRQCRLLSIGRSSFYYAPRGESPSSLALMRRIDELFMKYPFYGSRQMVRQLRRDGVCVGRHRVRRLMRLIGLEAIYQAPRTSVPHPMHRIYPYLLKGMAIDQPNRVWCADITYIPVQRGFLYLVAIMDWATRHVLSWRLSNTMDAGFCAEALGDALARYGQPEIFNTDQGSQFTSLDFTGVLKNASIRISMDGRGRCMDNIFIERLWRSLKYEAVYLHELTDGFHAERVIGEWIGFYNTERPHSSLDGQTPAEAYGAGQPVDMMDKARALPTSPQAQQQQQDVIKGFWQHDQTTEYTLTALPNCPTKWDHLRGRGGKSSITTRWTRRANNPSSGPVTPLALARTSESSFTLLQNAPTTRTWGPVASPPNSRFAQAS